MQKDLLKLALTGLAAGACLSAQGGGSEIAMTKCSRTPTVNEDQNSNKQMMQQNDQEEQEGEETGEEMNEGSSCHSQQGSSCANSCGNQGDQSSQNKPLSSRNFVQSKRLSAAKMAMGEDKIPSVDK